MRRKSSQWEADLLMDTFEQIHFGGSSAQTMTASPNESVLVGLADDILTGYVVEVTPALAQAWLSANTDNRAIRRGHVRKLARDITAGRWRFTHQGIAFSVSGRLIDGQHRLQAIIESGISAILTVFVGLDDNMFGALDRGAIRSVVDDIGRDRSIVEPCNWLARVLDPARYTSPFLVRELLGIYEPVLLEIRAAASGGARVRSAAPIRAALMVRMKSAGRADRDLLLRQWQAFLRLQIDDMDRTTGALLRRLESTNGAADVERGVVSWVGWNPAARNLTKVQVRDEAGLLDEMRAVAEMHRQQARPT